jgi:uncharacterized SAM-binding protein YcdF (DUF218 family)
MNWLITNFAAAFLLPPLNFLLLLALGAGLLCTAYAKIGRLLLWSAIATMFLFSMPIVGNSLLAWVEMPYSKPDMRRAQAIVVLGGGVYHGAPEYGEDTVRSYTLERLRYAARLQRQTGLPLLASGGRPEGGEAESVAMWNSLRNDFGVETRWVELTSLNTGESARNSYAILQPYGISHILLVTHAWHMPRARMAFEKAGFSVIPAGTVFTTRRQLTLLDFLPSAGGLLTSRHALHELIGRLWYRIKSSS